MGTSLQIVLLLAVAAATTEALQECDDKCLCPTSVIMDCTYRGLVRPPDGYWTNIEFVFLGNNDIAAVDNDSFKGYPDMEIVDLTSNKLQEIDLGDFSLQQNIRYLYLADNHIENIIPPPTGTRFNELEGISFPGNKLSFLDPDFFQFAPNLEEIFAGNNPLVVQEGQPILNIPTLKIFLLMNMTKLNVDPQTFVGLPNMKNCLLYSNGITNITGAFVTNKKLTRLHLQLNSITELTAGTLPEEKAITHLYLDDNPLEKLDLATVHNAMADGGILIISDTPLACSCNYEELYWWALENGITLSAECKGADSCSFTKRTSN